MTRFINAVLISVFAFFVFLGVFWQFQGGAEGRARPGGAPSVTAVESRWQPDPAGELVLELQVRNPSSLAARVAAVTFEAKVDGQAVDRAVAQPPPGPAIVVPGNGEAPVRVAIDLPDDFVLSWWTGYMAHAESADLRVQGTLSVRRDDGARDAPFEYRSTWEGDLAGQLSDAVENCGGDGTDVCLAGSRFYWEGGALHSTLRFRNPGSEPVAVRNTSVSLLFGGQAVVSGDVDVAQQVRPDGEAQVGLVLTFAPTAMTAWWPDHVARCERTPVALRMDLQVEPVEAEHADVTTLQWTFPASLFQTQFACGA